MGIAEHAVVVAGAGPTGMMLAGELTLAGVDVTVVCERHKVGPHRAMLALITRA